MRCAWVFFCIGAACTAQSYSIDTVAGNLAGPSAVALDAAGRVYYVDTGNSRVNRVELTGSITPIAGVDATLAAADIAVDSSGNLYIAGGQQVMVLPAGGTLGTLVEGFESLNAITVEPSGSLVVADGARLRRVSVQDRTFTEIPGGTGATIYDVIAGPSGTLIAVAGDRIIIIRPDGATEPLSTDVPVGAGTRIALDAAGELWISGERIWKLAGGRSWIMTGTGVPGFSGDGGTAAAAQVSSPSGMGLDVAGNLYFADALNNRIRVLRPPFAGSISAITPGARATDVWPVGVTLRWTPVPNASAYELLFGTSPDALEVLGTTELPVAQINFVNVRSTYYWRVRTRLLPLPTIQSPVFSFSTTQVTFQPPPQPLDLQPFNHTSGLPGSFWMTWRGGAAQRYEIYADENPLALTKIGETLDTRFFANGLKPNTRYYWRVVALNTEGRSGSQILQFITGPETGYPWLIDTVAGAPVPTGDGSFAIDTALRNPRLVTVDRAGNVFFVEGRTVRKIDANDRKLTTIYTAASGNITSLATNSQGDLFVAFSEYVVRVTRAGQRAIVAGQPGLTGFAGDDGVATRALFNGISSVAVTTAGELLIADRENNRIRLVTTAGVVRTAYGTGICDRVCAPSLIALDRTNNIFIASASGTQTDQSIATVTGAVSGLAVDASGVVHYIDGGTMTIRKLLADGASEIVAGEPEANGTALGFSGDGLPATRAKFAYPNGIAFDANGNLLIADTYNNRIRQIDVNGFISTIAGIDTTRSYPLYQPNDLAVDNVGTVYIADSGNNRVLRMRGRSLDTVANVDARNGSLVEIDQRGLLAFTDNRFAWARSTATEAVHTLGLNGTIQETLDTRIRFVGGIAHNAVGETFVSDTLGNRILRFDRQGNVSVTAGTGVAGFAGEGGPATVAQVNTPGALSISPEGDLYVAELGRIRRITSDGRIVTVLNENATGLAHNRLGTLFFTGSRSVFMVLGGRLVRIAGRDGAPAGPNEGGAAIDTRLTDARGIAVDPQSGDIYFADADSNVVRRLTPNIPTSIVLHEATAERLSIRVTGRTGRPVPGIPVQFAWDGRAGSTAVTNNDGLVFVNGLINRGGATLTAVATGIAVPFEYRVPVPVPAPAQ